MKAFQIAKDLVTIGVFLLAASCNKHDDHSLLLQIWQAEGVAYVAEKPCKITIPIRRLQSFAKEVKDYRWSEADAKKNIERSRAEAEELMRKSGQDKFCSSVWEKYGDNGLRIFIKAPPVVHLSPAFPKQ